MSLLLSVPEQLVSVPEELFCAAFCQAWHQYASIQIVQYYTESYPK